VQEVGDWRAIAASQQGVISRSQLLASGLSSDAIARLIRHTLEPCLRGIYRVRGSPRAWHQQLWAVQLWAGESSVFSHRTAWWCHGLDGLRERVIDVSTVKKSRSPKPNVVIHQTSLNRLPTPQVNRGFKITDVARTLLDIGAVARPWSVEFALEDALRKGVVDLVNLRTTLELEGGRGCPGSKVLRKLLDQRPLDYEALHSAFEILLERLINESTLPRHVRQHEVMTNSGIPADIDFAWPEEELGVEGEGYRWHSGRRRWQTDLDRQNALAEIGWLLLRFSYHDVTRRPQYVLQTISRTLAKRNSRTLAKRNSRTRWRIP
jgi:very-short-patch-repair endonuclease